MKPADNSVLKTDTSGKKSNKQRNISNPTSAKHPRLKIISKPGSHQRSLSHDIDSSFGNSSKRQINISDVLAESPLLSRNIMNDYLEIEKDVMLKEKIIEMGQNPTQLDKSGMRKVLIKNMLKYQDMGELANQLTKEKILLSGLSLPKYRSLLNNNSSHTTLHLPADFTYKTDPRPKEAFLSFEDIGTVNSSIIGFLEESLNKSKNNWNKFGNKLFLHNKDEVVNDKSLIDRILYSDKELTQIELEHNREQLQQIQKILRERQKLSYEQCISRIKAQNPATMKMPPIKVLPSRKDMYRHNSLARYEREDPKADESNSSRKERGRPSASLEGKTQYTSEKAHSMDVPRDVGGPLDVLRADKKLKFEKKPLPPNDLEPIVDKMSVFWFRTENITWRPELRESTAFTYQGKYGFMFGGLGKEIYDDLHVFDLEKLTWEKLQSEGDKSELGRYGHTVNHYNKNLIVFGGERSFNNQIRQRNCLSDLKILNLDTLVWKNIRPMGEYIEPRRNHTATIVGRHLIIKGGVNSKGTFLDDVWALELGQFKWSSLVHDNYERIPIAFHAACNVYHPSHTKQILYQENTGKAGELNSAIKFEGIYIFGGKSEKGIILDSLTILRTDRRPLQWVKPITVGKSPGPRFQHTMIYQLALGILVVFGGKDENNAELPGDLYILNLANLAWLKVEAYGTDPAPRSMHLCWPSETKVIITGGCSLRGLLNYDCYVCEMHKGFVQRFIKEDNHRRNNLVSRILPEKFKELENKKEKMRERERQADFENFSFSEAKHLFAKVMQEEKERERMKEYIDSLSFKKLITYVPVPMYKTVTDPTATRGSILNQEFAQKLHKETENLVKEEIKPEEGNKMSLIGGKLAKGAKQVILMNRFIQLSKEEKFRRNSTPSN